MKMRDKSKVLFLELSGIGNSIMLTPAFTNVKKNLPSSKVSVLLLNSSADVVRGNKYVDEVIVYPSKKNFFLRLFFLWKLRKKKFDYSFYPYPNVNIMSAILPFLIGAKYKINFYYKFFNLKNCGFLNTISVPVNREMNDVEKNLNLLKACGLKIYSKKLFINIEKKDDKIVSNLLINKVKRSDILVGMHIGSREDRRIWPTKNFASLVEKLSKYKKIKIILVGSDIEENLIKNFDEFKYSHVLNMINKTSIPQTTALIKKCRLFITNNSGAMHMAVAAGI